MPDLNFALVGIISFLKAGFSAIIHFTEPDQADHSKKKGYYVTDVLNRLFHMAGLS